MAATMSNHLAGKATPLEQLRPDFPIAVSRWVMRLMSQHPSDRPASAFDAMSELNAAREKANEEITDSIQTAKLAVPVVPAARPTQQSHVLQDTQQIIRTTYPTGPVTPGTSPQNPGTPRRYATPPEPKVNRKLVLAMIGSALLLVLLVGTMVAVERIGKKPDDPPSFSSSVTPSLPKKSPKKKQKPKSRPKEFENSSQGSDLPPLPRENELVAYYSLAGRMQQPDGSPFLLGFTTSPVGAIENIAPHAHKFHLIKGPDQLTNLPYLAKNQRKADSLYFQKSQRMMTPHRAFKNSPITSDKFTVSLMVRFPKDAIGGVFLLNVTGSDKKDYPKLIRLGYHLKKLNLQSDHSSAKVEGPLVWNKYRFVFVEYDGKKSSLQLWESGILKEAKLIDHGSLTVNVKGPVTLDRYEMGNLWIQRGKNKRIEVPAMSIHTGSLTDQEKLALVKNIQKTIFPDWK